MKLALYRLALALMVVGLSAALMGTAATKSEHRPLAALLPPGATATPIPGVTHFAVIGDYGYVSQSELDVASMVHSWSPEFIITTGDNNYDNGAASTIDPNIGQYYHDFIYPYMGSYGGGADTNRFFPSLGNHDWVASGAQPYRDYFTLPGNERYYDFAWGNVHFFAVDSDPNEPDGITSTSVQGNWLQGRLAAATEPWKLVYFHHPSYSSGLHGSTPALQWPFQAWGASAVLNGHDHDYERVMVGGFPYFVNGLGGRSLYGFGSPIPGSVVRYASDYGAQLVDATSSSITFRAYSRANVLIDSYIISVATPTPSVTSTATSTSTPTLTPTSTATYSPTSTATPTQVASTSTSTPTHTVAITPTSTSTAIPTQTATSTPSLTHTYTPTPLPTSTIAATVTSTITCCRDITATVSDRCEGSAYITTLGVMNDCTRAVTATGFVAFEVSPNEIGPWTTAFAFGIPNTSYPPGYTEQSGSFWSGPLPPGNNWWRARINLFGVGSDSCWTTIAVGAPVEACVQGTATPVTATLTPTRTRTSTAVPSITSTPPPATPPPTICAIQFTDVPSANTFYLYVRCLACRQIITGYPCGGEGEPCDEQSNPYFRPYNDVTRGQIAKIVSNSAGFNEAAGEQIYEDVPASYPFYPYIGRLSRREYMGGYPCGAVPEEPCGQGNRPYFRPGSNATRGQLAKIVSNAAGYIGAPVRQTFADVQPDHPFYVWIERLASGGIMGGYSCGGEGEPCDEASRPYFRPYNSVTRGQSSKIVSGAFFPGCVAFYGAGNR